MRISMHIYRLSVRQYWILLQQSHHPHFVSPFNKPHKCSKLLSQTKKKRTHPTSSFPTMDVIFEPQRGRPFSIEVGFFDTVLEIKEKIQKYHAIPISKQKLIFNGNVLQDNRNVEHCNILQSSHIQLIVSPEFDKSATEIESLPLSKKIQLNIKTLYKWT
jgi:hypothetical protein